MIYDIIYSCPEMQSSQIANRPHTGISYLCAYLKYKHLEAYYYRHRDLKTLSDYIDQLSAMNTLIYGFSVTDDTLDIVLVIAERLKQCKNDAFILIGGALGKKEVAEYLLKFPFIDGVAIGEGEYSTEALIKELKAGKSPINIPGIITLESLFNDKMYEVAPVDINSYPSPILSGLVPDCDLVEQGIMSSRGCVHQCIYCSFGTVSNRRVRFYEDERFLEEVKYVVSHLKENYTNHEIPIWDDTFSFNLVRAKRLLREIAKINKYGHKFWLQTRIDYIDEEFICLSKLAGISHIGIGLESASPKVLKLAKKVRLSNFDAPGYEPEEKYVAKFFSVIEWCKKSGIKYTINTIFGLPGETFNDALETIKAVENARPQFYFHANVRLYTGVPLARNFFKYGYSIQAPNLKDGDLLPPVNAKIVKYNYDVQEVPKLPYRQQKIDLGAITGFVHDTNDMYRNVTVSSGMKLTEKNINHPIFKNRTCFVKLSKKLSSSILENNYYSTELFTGIPAQLLFRTISVRLADLNSFFCKVLERFTKESYKRYSTYTETHMEIRIETQEDYEIANRISYLLENGGEISLPNNITSIQFGATFLQDSCRWNTFCSAYDDMRCFINEEGAILSCEKGYKIQDCKMFLNKTLHESFSAQHQKIVAQRNCNNCSIKKECSKCAAVPDEFIEKYCSIQRSKYKLSTLFRIVDYVIKHILNPLDLETYKTTGNSISFPPASEKTNVTFILTVNKCDYYVTNHDGIEIRRIGHDLSIAIKELWNRGNLNGFLLNASRAGMSENEIQHAVALINELDNMRSI